MVSTQIINRILQTGDISFVENNNITEDYFFTDRDEFNYIKDYYARYKEVPSVYAFVDKFPKYPIIEDDNSSNQYLIDKIREEHLFVKSKDILQKGAALLEKDANLFVEYITSHARDIKPVYQVKGIDIIHDSQSRYQELIDKKKHHDKWFFKSGFDELDDLLGGIQRKEEFVVLFARTSHGKSWVAVKMSTSIWSQGYNVGFFSPEMTPNSIGYRFDTLYKNFSNHHLLMGKYEGNDYEPYLDQLSKFHNKFLVANPIDFEKRATVSKLRNWIKDNDLHALFIDGISYLTDERYKKGDNATTTLTNISEDLMSLSVELHVPVIVIVQANRDAVIKDDAPGLETIRNSDGIAHNASKALSIRQKNNELEIKVQKNRNGKVGNRLIWSWNIDKGEFVYLPNPESGLSHDREESAKEQLRAEYEDEISVF